MSSYIRWSTTALVCALAMPAGAGGFGSMWGMRQATERAVLERGGAQAAVAAPGGSLNLALKRPAQQSSTYTQMQSTGWGKRPDVSAAAAVDGVTQSGMTHTNEDEGAFWQVDLGGVFAIKEIRVWNRADAADRTSDFYVLVSKTPFTGAPAAVLEASGIWKHWQAEPAGSPSVFAVGHRGRYVRVQLGGKNFLSLTEVEVIGTKALDKIELRKAVGSLSQLGVGNAGEVWGVTGASDVLRWEAGAWTKVAGKLTQIAVASDGTVVGINAAGRPVRLDNGAFADIGPLFPLKQVVAVSADVMYGLTAEGRVVRRQTGATWGIVAGAPAPVPFVRLGAASDGALWALTTDGRTFRYEEPEPQKPNPSASWGWGRNVQRAPPPAVAWHSVKAAPRLIDIAVASSTRAFGVEGSGKLWLWDGATWKTIAGALARISVSEDGALWGVNARGELYTSVAAGDLAPASEFDLSQKLVARMVDMARTLWTKLPARILKSPYASRTRFLADAADAARQLGPTVIVPMGIKTEADLEGAKKNVDGLLALRLDGYASSYLARIATLAEVAKRVEAMRDQFWSSVPNDAKSDPAGFNREFAEHLKTLNAELEGIYKDGATTPEQQQAIVKIAVARVETFTGKYGERQLNERAQRNANEEKRRRDGECYRANNVCVPVPTMNDCLCGPWGCAKCPGIRNECRTVSWHDPVCMARQFVSNAWEGIKQNVSQAWEHAKSSAQQVWAKVESGAKWATDKFEDQRKFLAEKWEQAKNLIGEEWERAKELLRDPVGYVWKHMKERLLQLWDDFVIKPVNAAKQALQSAVEGVKQGVESLLKDHVITPAMKWALDSVFGEKTYERVVDIATKVLGNVEKAQARDGAVQEALQALAERDLGKFDAALARYEAQIADLKGMRVSGILAAVVDYAKDRLTAFIKSKAVDLFNNVFDKFEIPLDILKMAAVTSLGSIPFAGGILAGLADFIITEGIRWLRTTAVEFVAQKIVELVDPMLSGLAAQLKVLVGKAEGFLQPIIDLLRPALADVNQRVGTMVASYERVAQKLKQARARVAADAEGAAAGGGQ